MTPRPIVLLTDFGAGDFYAGVLAAVVESAVPGARVIHLAHGLPAHDVAQASFVLARALPYLPDDAVVVVVVDPDVGGPCRGVLVEIEGRVAVGRDNGFASDVLASGLEAHSVAIHPSEAARVVGRAGRGTTFHGRDVFAPVAAVIAAGAAARDFGPPAGTLVRLRGVPSVSVSQGRVTGTGRYIDRFGNIMSDIPRAALESAFDRLDGVTVSVGGLDGGRLRAYYGEGRLGELMVLVNSWDLVEAAVNGGRAADRFAPAPPEAVRFELKTG